MATQAQIAAVQQLYIGYLGRAADKAGLDFWTNAVATGVSTLESVATGFTLSNEYKAAFGGLTNDALVEKVYTSVLGRASDTAGKAFWVDALAKGTVTADKLVATFIGALGAPDQTIINNKTFVAQTYTDTVGDTNFDKAGAAEAIANVDGTTASVNTALTAIANGTLTGSVPAQGLIAALEKANAAVTAYSDKLATDSPALDLDGKDGVSAAEAKTALGDAKADRAEAILAAKGTLTGLNGAESTARLEANVTDATTANTAAKAAVTAIDGGTAAINAYESAVAAKAALVGTAADQTAAAAAKAAAENGLSTALKDDLSALATAASTGLAADKQVTFANAAEVTTFLANPANESLVGRAALVTELKKVAVYGDAEVSVGNKALAIAKADALVVTTTDTLSKIDVATPAADADTAGETYINAATTLADNKAVLTAAQSADKVVADAQAIVDQFATLNKAVTDANTALGQFEEANTSTIDLHNVSAGELTTSAKADVFYFGSKIAAASESITSFGAGDKIVLGSSLTYNSGALTTGDNNKAEFFLVQKGNDTLVILETQNFGSSTVAHTATADTAAVTAPDANVITLTGVALADVTVANGVISHVA